MVRPKQLRGRRKRGAAAVQEKEAKPQRRRRGGVARSGADGATIIGDLKKRGLLTTGDNDDLVVRRIPIGIPQLDAILNGGLPRRRVTVLTGQYSSCKSFLIQMAMKEALDKGLQVAYIDAEQSYDPEWWAQCGIPLDKVLVSQPTTGEEAIDVVVALAHAGVDIIAVDSLAALVPKPEAESKTADNKFMGLQARLINEFMRKLLSIKHNSAIVCTNQLRDSIGPSPVEAMPGGKGVTHYTAIILRTQRHGWIEEKGVKVGFNLLAICRKNKVGISQGECILPFRFRGEIDLLSLLVDQADEAGMVTQAGPYYTLSIAGEQHQVLGKNSLLDLLRERDDLRQHLETAVGNAPQRNAV